MRCARTDVLVWSGTEKETRPRRLLRGRKSWPTLDSPEVLTMDTDMFPRSSRSCSRN